MTTSSAFRLLLIEDNLGDARLFWETLSELSTADYALTHCNQLASALDQLRRERFDVILSDLDLPDSQHIQTLASLLEVVTNTPIVVLTGRDDDALALQAIQSGAQDYLVKNDITGPTLTRAIRHAIERKRTERRQNAQYAITSLLAEAANLTEATPHILKSIGESLDWDMGELWIINEASHRLHLVELWHTSALQLSKFETFTRQRTFVYGDGFSGRVWANGQPLWMADILNEPGFPPLVIAAHAGLHSGFGFPIQLGRDILGIVTFFSRDIRSPDHDLLLMFASIGSQIGQFIERRRAEQKLRASEEKLNYLIRRFVPQAVAEEVMATPGHVQLGGEQRVVSVLFADIRGYTAITEKHTPKEVMDILNQYFGVIGRVILKHGGTINQYAGDMIMASFNAPALQSDHEARAVQAAMEAQTALSALRETTDLAAQFGMGVNTGPVVVGYVGFEDRFDYATLGETTNIAFRLSSMAEGGQVLIGEETLQKVRDAVQIEALGPLKLKGREQPFSVFRVERWLNSTAD